ncbi:hypothetical protein IEQ34_018514 [Dendrobium chrysotoxum]|uniref:Uncharacterized protein n=1 Tax=Dendrobium chrysotoxum TaxID=161865 RepID=A0AAV7FNL8_DENCH|nr:hypothetical protein IEQ34_018514 [Dendrobium chrysotoxum]
MWCREDGLGSTRVGHGENGDQAGGGSRPITGPWSALAVVSSEQEVGVGTNQGWEKEEEVGVGRASVAREPCLLLSFIYNLDGERPGDDIVARSSHKFSECNPSSLRALIEEKEPIPLDTMVDPQDVEILRERISNTIIRLVCDCAGAEGLKILHVVVLFEINLQEEDNVYIELDDVKFLHDRRMNLLLKNVTMAEKETEACRICLYDYAEELYRALSFNYNINRERVEHDIIIGSRNNIAECNSLSLRALIREKKSIPLDAMIDLQEEITRERISNIASLLAYNCVGVERLKLLQVNVIVEINLEEEDLVFMELDDVEFFRKRRMNLLQKYVNKNMAMAGKEDGFCSICLHEMGVGKSWLSRLAFTSFIILALVGGLKNLAFARCVSSRLTHLN